MRFWLKGAGVIFVAVVAIFLAFPHRELEWDDTIVPMAQRYAERGDSMQQPLAGTTVVVTGATNGIGLALTRALSKLGASVVALGRSKEKLATLQKEVPSIQTFQMDLSDLANVARTAKEILENVPSIDILVNNAGMHATSDLFAKYVSVGEEYDRVFVVNYLSHFLLTEKLSGALSRSKKPVLVQTSSSFHWAVDGSDLIPGKDGAPPIAAQPGGSRGFFIFRTQRSYANSKLAQILHARILQRRHPELQAARIVSFCPGWVATNIAGSETFATAILDKAAFPMKGWGIASALNAILDDDDDSDYYINSKVFNVTKWLFPRATSPWVYQYGVRDAIMYIGAMLLLWIQNLAPHAGPSRSSPESYNETIAAALYDWSLGAVAQFL